MGWEVRGHTESLEGQAEEFALCTTVDGSLFSAGFETFLRRAGNSLGSPDRAEMAAGLRTCRSLSPAGTGMWASGPGPALPRVAECSWADPGPPWDAVPIWIRWGLASMFAERPPMDTALWASGECWASQTSPSGRERGLMVKDRSCRFQPPDSWQSHGQT